MTNEELQEKVKRLEEQLTELRIELLERRIKSLTKWKCQRIWKNITY